MAYRDPILVIDETLENLVYLVEWWTEDLDVVVAREVEQMTWEDVKSIAALRATRALLPRLRLVRSNYEGSPSLPDAKGHPREQVLDEYCERSRIELRRLLYPPPEQNS